jgi:bacteriocin biosynthesis cyclodehydratase domain-containing protein
MTDVHEVTPAPENAPPTIPTSVEAAALPGAVAVAGMRLPQRPRLAPWVTMVDLGDDRMQFRGAAYAVTLRGRILIDAFLRVRDLLDGAHAIDEITASGEPEFLATTIAFALQILTANGVLHDAGTANSLTRDELTRWDREIRFWSHVVPRPEDLLHAMQRATITVGGSGPLAETVHSALRETGFVAARHAADARAEADSALDDLAIVCEDSPAYGRFDAVNEHCLRTGQRWMHVALTGTVAEIGPTVVPHQTACYACFSRRTEANLLSLDGYAEYRALLAAQGATDEGAAAPLIQIVAGQVALEAVRLLTGLAPPATVGRVVVVSALTPETSGHDVFRVPRCSACGASSAPRAAWDVQRTESDVRR